MRLAPSAPLDIRELESPRGYVRVAIVVPRFGHTAVKRNLVKRRLRELTRNLLLSRAGSRDLLIRARRHAYAADFAELEATIRAIVPPLEEKRRDGDGPSPVSAP